MSCELVQLFGLWEPFIAGREWWGFCSFQGSKVQTRVGLLMLLCTWLSNCSIAVTHFLHNPANVPFVSLTCLQVNITCLEVTWTIPVKIKCLSQSVCRDTCRYKSKHTGAGNKTLEQSTVYALCLWNISSVLNESYSWQDRLLRTWERRNSWCRASAHCCLASPSTTMTTLWKTTGSKCGVGTTSCEWDGALRVGNVWVTVCHVYSFQSAD